MAARTPEDKLMDRMRHLPVAIDNTMSKLERLFIEAGEYRMPIDDMVAARFDELRSHFLTNPKLVNDHWDKTIREARKNNRA